MTTPEQLAKTDYLRGLLELRQNVFFQELLEVQQTDFDKTVQIILDETPRSVEQFLLREQMIGELRGLSRAKRLLNSKIAALQTKIEHETESNTTNA